MFYFIIIWQLSPEKLLLINSFYFINLNLIKLRLTLWALFLIRLVHFAKSFLINLKIDSFWCSTAFKLNFCTCLSLKRDHNLPISRKTMGQGHELICAITRTLHVMLISFLFSGSKRHECLFKLVVLKLGSMDQRGSVLQFQRARN